MLNKNDNKTPLCVDLDGTLIATDTLLESALMAIKANPLNAFTVFFWLVFKGRAYLKARLSEKHIPSADSLPYRPEVLDFIKKQKAAGRQLVLATATNKIIADRVADHLGLFDMVLASDNGTNLRSANKRDKLVELFGEKGFDYMGDSHADIKVWSSSRLAIPVAPPKSLVSKIKSMDNTADIITPRKSVFKELIKEIRVYQWVKNVLLFAPMFLAHNYTDWPAYITIITAFLAFSFTASFVYMTNDLLDLHADRLHPKKRNRPLASGRLPITFAFIVLPLLFLIGPAISIIFLPLNFLIVLAVYFVLTMSYSMILKKVVLLDVMVLATLYTMRLIAGSVAVDVEISHWLVGFSMFFFLGLAFVKRFTELKVMISQNRDKTKGRGYKVSDINLLSQLGVASGFISVLILTLYIQSSKVNVLYSNPSLLWIVAFIILYWTGRMWIKAHRGEMHDDPIVFMSRDPVSFIIALIIGVVLIGASL